MPDLPVARLWQRVHHRDPRAVQMADRHYSRKSPGTPEFTEPGNKIVLLHFGENGIPCALWASHRPDPASGVKRADGREVWGCSIFRTEGATVRSSDLIREAVAITKAIWGEPLPSGGFFTTVNPKHVAPVRVRGRHSGEPSREVWGYCFQCAGWREEAERTKSRKLVVLSLDLPALQAVVPIYAPVNVGSLFGMEVMQHA